MIPRIHPLIVQHEPLYCGFDCLSSALGYLLDLGVVELAEAGVDVLGAGDTPYSVSRELDEVGDEVEVQLAVDLDVRQLRRTTARQTLTLLAISEALGIDDVLQGPRVILRVDEEHLVIY